MCFPEAISRPTIQTFGRSEGYDIICTTKSFRRKIERRRLTQTKSKITNKYRLELTVENA